MNRPSPRAIIAVLGLTWGLLSEAVYYGSGVPALDILRDLAIGGIDLCGGLGIWASRPENPTGRLMTLVGSPGSSATSSSPTSRAFARSGSRSPMSSPSA